MRRDSYRVKREEYFNRTSIFCTKTALLRRWCVRGSMASLDDKHSLDRDSRLVGDFIRLQVLAHLQARHERCSVFCQGLRMRQLFR